MKRVVCLILALSIMLGMGAYAAPLVQLNDVSGHWAETEIQALADKGIIAGKGGGYFHPQDTLTVAEYIKMCLGAIGQTVADGEYAYWATPYIDKAIELGMIDNGQFTDYNRPIIREEMAAVGINAYGRINTVGSSLVTGEIRSSIADYRAVSDRYKDSVLNTYLVGLMNGRGAKFEPQGTATRAEASVVVMRMLDSSLRVPFDLSSIPHVDTFYEVWNPEKEAESFEPDDPSTWDGYVLEPVTLYAPLNTKGERVTEVIDLFKFGVAYGEQSEYRAGAGYSPIDEGAGIGTMTVLKKDFYSLTIDEQVHAQEFSLDIDLKAFRDTSGRANTPYVITFLGLNRPNYMAEFKLKHGALWEYVLTTLFGDGASLMDQKITQAINTPKVYGESTDFNGTVNGRKYSGSRGDTSFVVFISDDMY